MADALETARRGLPHCAANQKVLDEHRAHEDGEWYGMDKPVGLNYLVALANGGWSKGAKRLFDSQDKISAPRVESLTRKMEWQDQGEEISLDRLYSGEFDQMWRGFKPTVKAGRSRVVKVVYGIACSGAADSEALFWSGACATVFADALCKAGYSVQVEAAIMGKHVSGEQFDSRIAVKGSEDPLSITNMAATLCLSGFFRCIGHCLSTIAATRPTGGLGRGFRAPLRPPGGLVGRW
jgi:hypothetical protein